MICPTCDSEFIPKNNSQRYCCEHCRQVSYRAKNRDKANERTRIWAQTNKESRQEVARKSRKVNIETHILRAAKERAKKFGLDFNLDTSDINIPEYCPILNIKLQINSGKPGGKFNSPSLDRVVPELGYIKGNVQVISFQANMMKSNATPEQLILFAKWILNEHN